MTYKDFYRLFSSACGEGDKDLFLARNIPTPTETLEQIWTLAHMPVREMRAGTGLSQHNFATRFCIPTTSYVQWEQGTRRPPDYVRLMMADLLGLVKVERE